MLPPVVLCQGARPGTSTSRYTCIPSIPHGYPSRGRKRVALRNVSPAACDPNDAGLTSPPARVAGAASDNPQPNPPGKAGGLAVRRASSGSGGVGYRCHTRAAPSHWAPTSHPDIWPSAQFPSRLRPVFV